MENDPVATARGSDTESETTDTLPT